MRTIYAPSRVTTESRGLSLLGEKAETMSDTSISGIRCVDYQDESQLVAVMTLVEADLSEPYRCVRVVLPASALLLSCYLLSLTYNTQHIHVSLLFKSLSRALHIGGSGG